MLVLMGPEIWPVKGWSKAGQRRARNLRHEKIGDIFFFEYVRIIPKSLPQKVPNPSTPTPVRSKLPKISGSLFFPMWTCQVGAWPPISHLRVGTGPCWMGIFSKESSHWPTASGSRCPWEHRPRPGPYVKNPTENVRLGAFSEEL